LLDIGAFVGDFAIRMASFARAKKAQRQIWAAAGKNHVFIVEFVPSRITANSKDDPLYLLASDGEYDLFDLCYVPCPTRASRIDSACLSTFAQEVSQRRYGYTDILAVPKALPGASALVARLSGLRQKPHRYSMIDLPRAEA
jgi:hypothetical protein